MIFVRTHDHQCAEVRRKKMDLHTFEFQDIFGFKVTVLCSQVKMISVEIFQQQKMKSGVW